MTKLIEVGQRVHCILHGGKDGTIFKIDGPQMPETVESRLGGLFASGGLANFMIVWDKGSISEVPESIIHGVQWHIYWDEPLEDGETIVRRLLHVKDCDRAKELAEVERQMNLEFKRNKFKTENPDLELASDNTRSHVLAAKNIRKQLKRAFPGVKFSVTSDSYSGGNAVRVSWDLGPTAKQVDEIVQRYEYGSFNGMEDIYEYDRDNVWSELFGGTKYTSTSRHIPNQIYEKLNNDFGNFCNVEGYGQTARFGSQWVSDCVYRLVADFPVPAGDTIAGWRRGDHTKNEEHLVPVLASEAPKPKSRYRYNYATGSLVAV